MTTNDADTNRTPKVNDPRAATRAQRLAKFRGDIGAQDVADLAFWREASPAMHARAAINLARTAEKLGIPARERARRTREMFPGFPPARRTASQRPDD